MRLISPDALAAVTILQEAEGEPYEGKIAVGEVIRRRMALRYMSDGTVEGTVLRALQFSGWNATSSNRIRTAQADDSDFVVSKCVRAWADSATSNLAPEATDYYSPRAMMGKRPAWASKMILVAIIGNHRFYRDCKPGEAPCDELAA